MSALGRFAKTLPVVLALSGAAILVTVHRAFACGDEPDTTKLSYEVRQGVLRFTDLSIYNGEIAVKLDPASHDKDAPGFVGDINFAGQYLYKIDGTIIGYSKCGSSPRPTAEQAATAYAKVAMIIHSDPELNKKFGDLFPLVRKPAKTSYVPLITNAGLIMG
jgi:hypothetical protein